MTASIEDSAHWLSRILLPLMRYRVARMGVDASGAFRFYSGRLDTCRVFTECELIVARAVAQHNLEIDEIHEIGCGWGQLVFLFAWAGYRAIGFEIDSRRFTGAHHLHAMLMQLDAERSGRASIRNEFFPPARRPPPRSMALATNLVGDHPEFVEEQMLWGLRRYRYALLDIDRFCRLRQPEERPAFLGRFAEIGLRDCGIFCDAGADGRFHLFEQSGASAAAP